MYKKFTSHLYYKIALLVSIFSILLIALIFFIVDYYYTDQDTIMDAHELYFYSSLVEPWSFPSDTSNIKSELSNLHCFLSIYSKTNKNLLWSYPEVVNPEGYIIFSDSEQLGDIHNIKIPLLASFGQSEQEENLTMVTKNDLVYFFSVRQEYSSEYINYLPPIILLLVFMFGLNYFIQYTLRPIKLMKKRMYALRGGDLAGSVPIVGNDELAELSKEINKMTLEIKSLLGQKQQLLLDVSHELRSPLSRIRLLVEMIPEHKNQKKLIGEIVFLDGMISNLLLSDKLSIPYSNLEYENINVDYLIIKVLDLVGLGADRVNINNLIPGVLCKLDETKMIIAIRNIIDNALKYSFDNESVDITINREKKWLFFEIKSIGQKINVEERDDIFKPFFRSKRNKPNVVGFGLGLTICKKIIDAHGGKLRLHSSENETVFVIYVPFK